MTFLLDTNVLSERTSVRPHAGVIAWTTTQAFDNLHVSVVTLAELRYGVEKLPAGAKRRRLSAFVADVADGARGRLLPIDAEVALEWGRLRRRAEVSGRTMPSLDLWLAATAEVHQLTLVTRNTRDFEAWGGPVFDPWTQASSV